MMNKRLKKKKGLSKIREEELWGLDVTLAKYILPRLIRFKDINDMSYPHDFESHEQWRKTIDKMIYAFEYVIKSNYEVYTDLEEERKRAEKYREGMLLFAEYFMDLWD